MTLEDWQDKPDKQHDLRVALEQPIMQEALATLRQMARPRTFNPVSAEAAGLKLYQMAGWLDALDTMLTLCKPPVTPPPRTDGVQVGERTLYPEDILTMTPDELHQLQPNQT